MDTKNFKSLESLQTASDVENMLRLLARLPNLNMFTRIDGELANSIEPDDIGFLSKSITADGTLTVTFYLAV